MATAEIECSACGWRHTVPCGRDDCPYETPALTPLERVREVADAFREGYDAGYERGESGEAEDKEDAWDRSRASRRLIEQHRCEGRYPVPQTAPPRDEPFEVTYRCALPTGHAGPHGASEVE